MEKIYTHKTEEGKFEIKISLSISTWMYEHGFKYNVMTSFIPKGKRKARSLSDETENLPKGVLLNVKLSFWESIKPK